ncbi:ABC transporter ATP-binding protein [Jiangella muralis]|uniref:ABC transporter ATP-binding protein n=1 Tax=Jiangella muralis TaxID=702383 RepID=UPI00069F4093|nr:ABC transporter ATP-binding protein [Jiangella muralis]
MTGPGLDVRGLAVTYRSADGDRQALEGLDLTVAPGRTVGLIGRSGSGKTTAGKAVLGLLPRTATVSGEVRFDGQDLLAMPERHRRRLRWEHLALVPQAAMSALDPVMAVDAQLAEVVRAHRGVGRKAALALAHQALERVGIHADRASSYPHQFSGGMRQRALIAMATVLEPSVLVADEPTTGLDVIVQDRVLELLVRAKEELGLALLVVTHDLGVANELCDHVVALEHGRVRAAGTPAQVLGRPADAGVVLPRPEREPVPALEVSGVTVSFAGGRGLAALRRSSELTVLRDVSLTVGRGEVVGLAGESGCGKSSLAGTLVGLTSVDEGVIRVAGHELAAGDRADWRPLRRHVQMIFQDPYDSLNPRLRVRDAVAEPLVAQRLAADDADRDRRVARAMDDAGLTPASDYLDRYPYQLSGGERQRVAIARALVVEPRVILADEPVSMLDEHTAAGVVALLAGLARRLDVAVLLVSHDVSLLRRVCDRVAVMYLGRIVEQGPARDVLDGPRHPYTQALVRAVPSRVPGERRARVLLDGEPPSLRHRPTGCAFHPRCPVASPSCAGDDPPLLDLAPGHGAACWHPVAAATEKGAARA